MMEVQVSKTAFYTTVRSYLHDFPLLSDSYYNAISIKSHRNIYLIAVQFDRHYSRNWHKQKMQKMHIAFLPLYGRFERVMSFMAQVPTNIILTRQNEFSNF